MTFLGPGCLIMFFFSIKDIGISADKHALIIPPFMSRGKRVHPMPFPDSSVPGKLFVFCFGLLVYNGLSHVPCFMFNLVFYILFCVFLQLRLVVMQFNPDHWILKKI